MCRHLFKLALASAAAGLALPGRVAAQGPSPEQIATRITLRVPVTVGTRLTPTPLGAVLPDSIAKKKDHTVTGLVIGAGVGMVAGWVFYDMICEAVDNRCSNSRLPFLTLGAAIGGGLGALVGSGIDRS